MTIPPTPPPGVSPSDDAEGAVSSRVAPDEEVAVDVSISDPNALEHLGISEGEVLALLTDALSQIVWVTDANGSVEWCNQPWYDFTGLAPAEMRSHGVPSVLHPEDLPGYQDAWDQVRLTGNVFEGEYRLHSKEGGYRWFLIRSIPVRAPLPEEEGTPPILHWIGSATNIDDRKRTEERRRFLSELEERTRNLTDPDAIVKETVRSVGEFLGLLRFHYNETDTDAGTCTLKPDWGWGEDLAPTSVLTWPYSVWGPEAVAELSAGHTFVLNDLSTDPRTRDQYRTLYLKQRMRALVRIPILRGGRWVAVFSAHSEIPRRWSIEDIALLEEVARRSWVTLEEARLRHAEREQAAHQARVVETLQRSLLLKPERNAFAGLEVFPLYEAASDEAQVGGDFFYCFRLDGGAVALCLGDVTGHGVGAALFTADLKFSLRNYLRERGNDPVEALERLNQHVLDGQRLDGQPVGILVCAAVAIVFPSTGEVTIASAGIEPPLVYRAASGTVEMHQEAMGPILGVLPTWKEGQQVAHTFLGEGDMLALYSDGISEARQGKKGAVFFGPEGVARALSNAALLGSLERVAEAVVDAAKDFAAAGTLTDDVCLLLARRTNDR